MGLDTRIRFTAPIDPRIVWHELCQTIDAPADYAWESYPPNNGIWDEPYYLGIPHEGVYVLPLMIYGPEGSTLNDSDYDHDDIPEDQKPPKGYAEVNLTSRYSSPGAKHHDRWARELIARVGIPAVIRDDYTGVWSTVLS